nr:MAG TPA: minor capsid protein [Microviridae sp.]
MAFNLGSLISAALPAAGAFFGGPTGAALGGGISSAYNADRQNAAAAGISRDQMVFQERMSGTSYQRGVEDLNKAGLNPMLAYGQGGASSPGGTSAPVTAPDPNTGSMAARNAAEIKQIQAMTDKTKLDALVSAEMIPKVRADARQAETSAQSAEATIRKMGWETDTAKSESEIRRDEQAKSRLRYIQGWDQRFKQGRTKDMPEIEYEEALAKSERARREVNPAVRKLIAEALLREYEVPGSRNQARIDESGYGHARPLLRDVGSIINSAGAARRGMH